MVVGLSVDGESEAVNFATGGPAGHLHESLGAHVHVSTTQDVRVEINLRTRLSFQRVK